MGAQSRVGSRISQQRPIDTAIYREENAGILSAGYDHAGVQRIDRHQRRLRIAVAVHGPLLDLHNERTVALQKVVQSRQRLPVCPPLVVRTMVGSAPDMSLATIWFALVGSTPKAPNWLVPFVSSIWTQVPVVVAPVSRHSDPTPPSEHAPLPARKMNTGVPELLLL